MRRNRKPARPIKSQKFIRGMADDHPGLALEWRILLSNLTTRAKLLDQVYTATTSPTVLTITSEKRVTHQTFENHVEPGTKATATLIEHSTSKRRKTKEVQT